MSVLELKPATIKESLLNLVENMPEDVTWDDIQYQMYVCEAIEKGLQEMEESDGIPQEEAERIMDSWFE